MRTARIFRYGNSQAVRPPKNFRFEADHVEIFRRGDEVVLRERPRSALAIFDLLASLPEDFIPVQRRDSPSQKRKCC